MDEEKENALYEQCNKKRCKNPNYMHHKLKDRNTKSITNLTT